MDELERKDIRRLLKTFGVQADEALIAHLARNPDVDMVRVRITLEDLTEYGSATPDEPLHVEVEGKVRREGDTA
jgi:rhamnose utilization protein RhaD (predicted bifunctional aldolase and dehydrogenase)